MAPPFLQRIFCYKPLVVILVIALRTGLQANKSDNFNAVLRSTVLTRSSSDKFKNLILPTYYMKFALFNAEIIEIL